MTTGNWCYQNALKFALIMVFASLGQVVSISKLRSRRFGLIISGNMILYFQEEKFDIATTPYQNIEISSVCPQCGNSEQYGISVWVKKKVWIDDWQTIFRVSNDPA